MRLNPLWRMRNVLKGRNFHNRRSLTCGSLSISFFCLKGRTCLALPCPALSCL
ncbi:MAG: hypothetical protein LBF89_03515 [Bacteroidales bacterium]|nr:hypothetical protein [Bacteroidales bacterium]